MKQWMIAITLTAITGPLAYDGVYAQSTNLTPEQRQEVRKLFKGWSQEHGAEVFMGDTSKTSINYGDNFSGSTDLQGEWTTYAKPFLKAPKAVIGGYIDFTVSDCNGSSQDCSRGLEFDQERFIPFFYSQVTDRLSVAVELEIEHGGPNGNQSDGETKLEFALMDYRLSDALNFRGGIILMPMGRFNLIHDSPLNDLPLRPMVSRRIIPSTFSESGFGFFGSFYPTQLAKVNYEIYMVNGFDGTSTTASTITESNGMRSSRGSLKNDNNENKAIAGHLAISPFLGVEVGGSMHHGKWDDTSDNELTLTAIDGNLQHGPWELQGEAAWVSIQGGVNDPSSTQAPSDMSGFYAQLNYHFMPERLKKMAPSHFTDASTFTGIIRFGRMDTNTNRSDNKNEVDRLTLGVNFRPTEDSVFKVAYTFNDHNESFGKIVGSASNPGAANGWQASLATYF